MLYILQGFGEQGGTEAHVRTLTQCLADRLEAFIVFPLEDRICLLAPDGSRRFWPGWQPQWPVTPWHDADCFRALDQVLQAVDPDLIHVQHFLNWPLGLIDHLNGYPIPVVISFHDYYPINPVFTGQGVDEHFVPYPRCTSSHYSLEMFGTDLAAHLKQRSQKLAESIALAEARIVPSAFLKNALTQAIPADFEVVPHGIQSFEVDDSNRRRTPVDFCYIGSPFPQKGCDVLIEAFEACPVDARLHVFGGGSSDHANDPNIRFHGPYRQAELPDMLANVDIGVIPSLFAETFCLVLSEFWMAGIPVIASDLGALGDRLVDGENGWTFAPGDSGELTRVLESCCLDQDWRSWTVDQPRSAERMAKDYLSIYRSLAG